MLIMCIKDNITVGHDAITLKSGCDEYMISYSKPSSNIHITNVFLQSLLGSALAFGSEMSSGISDTHADHLQIHSSHIGVNFKTMRGRCGFVEDVLVSDVEMQSVNTAINFDGHFGCHPDDRDDPDALPVINRITIKEVIGTNIVIVGALYGIKHDPFTAICLLNINMTLMSSFVDID